MKRISMILALLITYTLSLSAQGFNDKVNSEVTLSSTIIQTFGCEPHTPPDDGVGSLTPGSIKTLTHDNIIEFIIVCEPNMDLNIVLSGPEAEIDGVSLVGGWNINGVPATPPVTDPVNSGSGTIDIQYVIESIHVESGAALGPRHFNFNVTFNYIII